MDPISWNEIIKAGPAYAVIVVLCYLLVTRDKQIDSLKDALQDLVKAIEVQNMRCDHAMRRLLDSVRRGGDKE